jgi:hypothetical protein
MLGGSTELTPMSTAGPGRWRPERLVKGVACDTPVPGYGVPTANILRLWKAEAVESFDFDAFNVGDYQGAVEAKVASRRSRRCSIRTTIRRSASGCGWRSDSSSRARCRTRSACTSSAARRSPTSTGSGPRS